MIKLSQNAAWGQIAGCDVPVRTNIYRWRCFSPSNGALRNLVSCRGWRSKVVSPPGLYFLHLNSCYLSLMSPSRVLPHINNSRFRRKLHSPWTLSHSHFIVFLRRRTQGKVIWLSGARLWMRPLQCLKRLLIFLSNEAFFWHFLDCVRSWLSLLFLTGQQTICGKQVTDPTLPLSACLAGVGVFLV